MTEPASSFVTRSPAPLAAVEHSDDPVVSFVIVTFGTGDIVIEAIDRLTRSTSTAGVPHEVIVTDNPHPDVPGATLRSLALSTTGVRVLSASRNLGFGGGCDLGVLHARGRVVAFVNPDLLVHDGWIRPLLDQLGQGTRIVAPLLLDTSGAVQEAGVRLHADGSTSPIVDAAAVASGQEVPDFASAACWLVERDEYERIGGFDPDYFPAFYEDADLAIRARRLGGEVVVVTQVGVAHLQGSGTHQGSRSFETWRQRDRLLARHPEIAWTGPPPNRSQGG
jgi:GT2 family glycosyltransferase